MPSIISSQEYVRILFNQLIKQISIYSIDERFEIYKSLSESFGIKQTEIENQIKARLPYPDIKEKIIS